MELRNIFPLISIFISGVFSIQKLRTTTPGPRLPRTILPKHYEISIIPSIELNSFSGSVDITFNVADNAPSSLNDIELNYKNLHIDDYSVTLKNSSGEIEIGLKDHFEESEKLVLVLTSDKLTQSSDYVLHLEYTGTFSSSSDGGGLILSTFDDQKYIIANAYPTYARQIFPCFDEPFFRATFNVSVRRPDSYKESISNMPLLASRPTIGPNGKKLVWDIFQETPPMSTSSFGLLVSPLTSVYNSTQRIKYLARTVNETKQLASFPFYSFVFQLSYNALFKNYSLPVINVVFLPDLFTDTFESWGIIYVRSNQILMDLPITNGTNNIIANVKDAQKFQSKIAKQFAAQSFGDSLSPEWWDDIWIKEAIAQYYGIFFSWRYDQSWSFDEFLAGSLKRHVMQEVDELRGLDFPIVIKVNTSTEVQHSLKTLRSQKGVAFLFMLLNSLSETIFDAGLQNFLKNDVGTTNQLIDIWQSELEIQNVTLNNNLTIDTIVHSWLLNQGVPIINVQRKDADVGNQTILITQAENSEIFWYIPLTYTTGQENNYANRRADEWFGPYYDTHDNKTHYQLSILDAVDANDYVIFNIKSTGLYRVNYESKNWQLLTNQLTDNHTIIDVLNRAQLVDDAFSLAWSGLTSYTSVLSLGEYLVNETEYSPWLAASKSFNNLYKILPQTEPVFSDFKDYMYKLVNGVYQNIGFEGKQGDSYDDILLRAQVLKWACNLGNQECINKAQTSFEAYIANQTAGYIRSEYLPSVSCGGMQNMNKTAWMEVYNFYKSNKINSEYLLKSLACVNDQDVVGTYLNLITNTSEGLTSSEMLTAIHAVAKRPVHTNYAVQYLCDNSDFIYNTSGDAILANMVWKVGHHLTTQQQGDKIKCLLGKGYGNLVEAAVNRTESAVQKAVSWLDKFSEPLENYFYYRHPTTSEGPFPESTSSGTTKKTTLPTPKPTQGAAQISFCVFTLLVTVFVVLFN